MIKRIFILIVFLAVLFPSSIQAQEMISFSSMEVDLWPEFDRPLMLVIYRITLAPDVSLPVELSLRIPKEGGPPNAVAARQPGGSLINIPYEQQKTGEWIWLVFQATTPEVQIEYYDAGLAKQGSARHYEYQWPGDYATDSFIIQVQEPVGAINMRISPSLGTGVPASDGLVYYTAEVGPLAQGQSFKITIDYQKDNDELSMGSVPVDPSGPLDESTSGRMSMPPALALALGGLGFLLIVGGAIWYWQSGRDRPKTKVKRRSRRKKPDQYKDTPEDGGYIYCHQCGNRASRGDRFCRACGMQLRG